MITAESILLKRPVLNVLRFYVSFLNHFCCIVNNFMNEVSDMLMCQVCAVNGVTSVAMESGKALDNCAELTVETNQAGR